MSLRDEAESKLEKFAAILEAELLNLKALKELSWQGVPRKVVCDIQSHKSKVYTEFLSTDASGYVAFT